MLLNNLKLKEMNIPVRVTTILQGQCISLLIATMGVFATLLSDIPRTHVDNNYPTFMCMCNYLLLATYLLRDQCHYGQQCLLGYKYLCHYSLSKIYGFNNNNNYNEEEEEEVIQQYKLRSNEGLLNENSGQSDSEVEKDQVNDLDKNNINTYYHYLYYIMIAFVDVEGNYLIIKAYQYTSITSIMLLDCFTIPCAMLISYIFLHYKYTLKHYIGVMTCIIGLICIVYTDSLTNVDQESNQFKLNSVIYGDILCLSGAALYAISNVLQEHLVKEYKRQLFLGVLGFFGFIIAFIQFLILEYNTMENSYISPSAIGYIFGFVICIFLMYVNTSVFLKNNDAILFNLSMLTSDVYAVIFSYFFYHHLVHYLYFVAFGLVVIGLFIYHSEVPPIILGSESTILNHYNNQDYTIQKENNNNINHE
jgi:solute carrier family 35 protein F1/2